MIEKSNQHGTFDSMRVTVPGDPTGSGPGHRDPPRPGKSAISPTANEHGAISCGSCGARWGGLSRAHCGACHRSFTGVSYFDRHRTVVGEHEHGGCLDPAGITDQAGAPVMVLRAGLWGGVEMTEEQRAAAFGRV